MTSPQAAPIKSATIVAARDWFVTREIAPRTWLICEPGHVSCWLLAGSDRAVLIDSGLGVSSIADAAHSLVSVPISVVNTHHHFDHVGGNADFEVRMSHAAGAKLVASRPNPRVLSAYQNSVDSTVDLAMESARLHRELYGTAPPEDTLKPLPRPLVGATRPVAATHLLEDGERIDLGDRSLTALHAPGHSPDSLFVVDEQLGIAAVGDSVNLGEISVAFPGADPQQLAHSLGRLIDADIRTVLPGHYPRPITDISLLREIIHALGDTEVARRRGEPSRDILDNKVIISRHERFFIAWPDQADPAQPLVLTE